MTTKSKRSTGSTKAIARKASGVTKPSAGRQRASTRSTGETPEIHQLKEPRSPMPAQHQRKPGREAKMTPRPRYTAPFYKGADKLRRKVALITGGDSGIGRAVAVLFAREGADVAFTHLPEEESDAEETLRAIKEEGSTGLSISGDIRDPEFSRRAVRQTLAKLGKLDILV